MNNATANKGWLALVALAAAQFLMVLDQSVMNVSISALVHDFHTTVTTIQAVITLYCLVMAMLILTGAKIGDMIGRRRAFVIGLIIYACGSALTALSQSVAMLALGWSVLEGIGASLVFPALAALIAGNFAGPRRKAAYAVIGGVISADVSAQVGVAAGSNTNFASSTQIDAAAKKAGLDATTTAALVDDYESAQLRSLKAGLLAAALLALISLGFTRELPHERPAPRTNRDPVVMPT